MLTETKDCTGGLLEPPQADRRRSPAMLSASSPVRKIHLPLMVTSLRVLLNRAPHESWKAGGFTARLCIYPTTIGPCCLTPVCNYLCRR